MITQGNWRVSKKFDVVTVSPKGVIIGSDRICDYSNSLISKGQELDNGRLIAAAPELLAAMTAMFKECVMIHKYGGEIYNGEQANAAVRAGRDAIVKAEAVQ